MSSHDRMVIVLDVFLLLLVVAQLALASWILINGRRRASSFLMAAFLILQSLPFIYGAIYGIGEAWGHLDQRAPDLGGLRNSGWFFIGQIVFGLAGVALLGFAIAYPSTKRLPGPPWYWILSALVLAALTTGLNVAEWSKLLTWEGGSCETIHNAIPGGTVTVTKCVDPGLWSTIGLLATAIGYFVASGMAAFLLWFKMRRAPTPFARRRIGYLFRVLVYPLSAAALLVSVAIPVEATRTLAHSGAWGYLLWLLSAAGILILMVLPPFGLGYGVLRYQVLDLNRRLTLVAGRTLFGLLILVGLFVLAEFAQNILQNRTQSTLVGLAGAAVLMFALRPVERRIMHGFLASQKVLRRRQRRLDLYRAALEDALEEGPLTPGRRRLLDALSQSFELSPTEVTSLESELLVEPGRNSKREQTDSTMPAVGTALDR